MQIRKAVFLLLALLLPVSFFLFLKFFGKNKFEVAPLFQVPAEIPDGCSGNYEFPYFLPDSMNIQLPDAAKELMVISFDNEADKQLNRIREEFLDESVAFLSFAELSGADIWKQCVFLMSPEQDVVLVDRERRVRGQYDGSTLEEMDRLLVEMKILLNKY